LTKFGYKANEISVQVQGMAIHLTYKISNPKHSVVHSPKTFIGALLIDALDNLL
jgi:hypothetical protein